MRKTTTHQHGTTGHKHFHSTGGNGRMSIEARSDVAINNFVDAMDLLETRSSAAGADMETLFKELTNSIQLVKVACRAMEQHLGDDHEALLKKQNEFRDRTHRLFSQSYLMNRARTWPRGYQGDFQIIEKAYDNQITSNGIGHLLDHYFLTTTLASGIRHRRIMMRDILADEMRRLHDCRILNIGCGPCREVRELASVIQETNARFTCIDFDTEALAYSEKRLAECGIREHVELRQYNAIRFINVKKNIETFSRFDVIYTIGLLDYLTDDILVRMIKALYATLNPGGTFIAVFKDADAYETEDYHWLVQWTGFGQRDQWHSRRLFQEAGIPNDALSVERTPDGVMIFYLARQPAKVPVEALKRGPHDRRIPALETVPRQPSDRTTRPQRERPSERTV